MAQWVRWLERSVLGLLVVVLVGVAVDWGVWRVREAHGSGTGSVVVSRMVVAPLKGNREEYYPDGTEPEACSRSIVPWGGMRACWYAERHRVVFER